MSGTIEARLKELGIELPQPTAPLANYVPFTIAGHLVFIAGQISQWNGERRFVGKLGAGISIADGQQAARLCALNIIAHCAPRPAAIWTAYAAVCGSAGLSTARPSSPTCRRWSTAPPI